ncbi:MAG: protein kinase, partial [Myxococcota bacterium]
EAAASVDSPHVIEVYDVDRSEDGRPFFVSELLTGQELGDYLDERGKIDVSMAVGIVRQICQALIAAHQAGVVHRDMKPENVYLAGDLSNPVAKVLDFGISRLEGQAGNTLTKTGMVMGTPAYMAPEQAKGFRVDHRADIYSVGAILYQSVTGRIPFNRADATATLAAVLTEEPDPPRSIVPSIPQHLELIIQRAMAREPEDRYQSMRELDEALAPYDNEPPPADSTGRFQLTRPTQSSVMDASRAVAEVADARGQLVVFGSMAALGTVAVILGLLAGAARFFRDGQPLSGVEALVVGLVIAAAVSTPFVLIVRHIRQTTWGNTAKVVELVRRLREPVTVGVVTYGLFALAVRTSEAVFVRSRFGLSWPGWDLVMPIAALAGGLFVFIGRGQDRNKPGFLDGIRPTVFAVAGGLVCLLLVTVGFLVQGAPPTVVAAETPPSESEKGAPPAAGTEEKRASPASREPMERKPVKDKRAAERAWQDVLNAHKVGDGKGAVDAIAKVFDLDPDAPKDPAVEQSLITITVRSCLKPTDLCERLLKLLSEESNDGGVDVLYDLVVTKGGTLAAKKAKALLQEEEVIGRSSRDTQLAFKLRFAGSCEKKKELFDEVEQYGNKRCLRELEILKTDGQCRNHGCCLNARDKDLARAIRGVMNRR